MAAEFHRGRMLDHVHLHSADLKASRMVTTSNRLSWARKTVGGIGRHH
jgi:hypothetical protein